MQCSQYKAEGLERTRGSMKRKWMRKGFWEEVWPELSIKRCEGFIQVDMEKIKKEVMGFLCFWGEHRMHIEITDILAKASYGEESRYFSIAKIKQTWVVNNKRWDWRGWLKRIRSHNGNPICDANGEIGGKTLEATDIFSAEEGKMDLCFSKITLLAI